MENTTYSIFQVFVRKRFAFFIVRTSGDLHFLF